MLTMLPKCSDNYLPVFRCVHGFCIGEGFLGAADEPLLVEQMKLCALAEGGELSEKNETESDESTEGKEKGEIHVCHKHTSVCVN